MIADLTLTSNFLLTLGLCITVFVLGFIIGMASS